MRKRMYLYICMTGSLCCTTEIDKTLLINHNKKFLKIITKKKKKKEKKKEKNSLIFAHPLGYTSQNLTDGVQGSKGIILSNLSL